MTDTIADMLTRIRNAVAVKKSEVILPFSKIKYNIAKLLEQENYVAKVEKVKIGQFDELKIVLKYNEQGPAIHHIRRISRPGQRIYISGQEMPRILNGYGSAIISTSQGVMTSQMAKKQNIGGELMCEIW
ncbi:MAG: 30S ribosomal protein S8 [Parcubacteria group bacterium]|nr:MAG: 30S ribosomal protein S8 [Parcubacteria group bacterium]